MSLSVSHIKFVPARFPIRTIRAWIRKILVTFCAFLTLLTAKAYAQGEIDYSVHANIIYHFTKYVDWPGQRKSGEFVIGVVGDSPIYEELKKATEGKKAGSQPIVVKKFSASSAAFRCHILFIGNGERGSLRKIAAGTAGEPVLIVSESRGLAQKGSCINFVIVRDKLKMEINKSNIDQRGLNIASELLKLGTRVD